MADEATRVTPAEENIQNIASLERKFLEERRWLDRAADAIAGFTGSIYFVLLHIVALTLWFLINTGHFLNLPKFDPYPFILLAMAVSVEAVVLSTFVLMKQNRMAKRAEQRDQLNLQIDLLAEQEITKLLQLQRSICEHLGIRDVTEDPVVKQLSETTSVQTLAQELKQKLPKEPAA